MLERAFAIVFDFWNFEMFKTHVFEMVLSIQPDDDVLGHCYETDGLTLICEFLIMFLGCTLFWLAYRQPGPWSVGWSQSMGKCMWGPRVHGLHNSHKTILWTVWMRNG